ncbi:hypothetical protein P171DRAFT_492344 [Karstenula rhodostoma CBS 690.94]|uniref:Uncharacterized protein n=1 Tax=Karstenula rhodostoma CBS 690.94 TaxID=1392251 RepID=A0A9P4P2S7_9PLEO|nr:hypothetical protein P171DRAFT_492344 [Karstenula rhodostoma CBS 690.94]
MSAKAKSQVVYYTDLQRTHYPGRLQLAAILLCLVLSSLDVVCNENNAIHLNSHYIRVENQTAFKTTILSFTTDSHSLEDMIWYASAKLFPVATKQSIWGTSFKYFPVKVVYLFSILNLSLEIWFAVRSVSGTFYSFFQVTSSQYKARLLSYLQFETLILLILSRITITAPSIFIPSMNCRSAIGAALPTKPPPVSTGALVFRDGIQDYEKLESIAHS